jgi:gamma-glutamyltranspeptidase / glutathione hydrolase
MKRRLRSLSCALLLLVVGVGQGGMAATSAAPATSARPALAPAKIATRHMIVAAEPDAAEAGLAMLRQGGSAVDAAIAAEMVLTLEEPQSSGIGGGAYMIVADGATLTAYDGREIAPASASPSMFLDGQGRPRDHADVIPGGLSVGVPGALRMLALAHAKHGRLPWGKLFEPAIRLAEDGFTVPGRLARELAEGGPQLAAMPGMRELFFSRDGRSLRVGEKWRNQRLAQTFRLIAEKGADAFYTGPIAAEIARAVTNAPRNPTRMTERDIAGYAPKTREPLCAAYRGYRLCSVPPSTSGGTTVLQILGMLERFPSGELRAGTLSAVHLISEAERLAYADRDRWLGDPDFVSVPLSGLVDRAYLQGRARLIDPLRAMMTATAGTPPVKQGLLLDYAPQPKQIEHGTTHLSVVDDRGEVVSMTASIEAGFGAQIAAAGFLLNNELTDFSFVPAENGIPVANAPAPGKRPLSAQHRVWTRWKVFRGPRFAGRAADHFLRGAGARQSDRFTPADAGGCRRPPSYQFERPDLHRARHPP